MQQKAILVMWSISKRCELNVNHGLVKSLAFKEARNLSWVSWCHALSCRVLTHVLKSFLAILQLSNTIL